MSYEDVPRLGIGGKSLIRKYSQPDKLIYRGTKDVYCAGAGLHDSFLDECFEKVISRHGIEPINYHNVSINDLNNYVHLYAYVYCHKDYPSMLVEFTTDFRLVLSEDPMDVMNIGYTWGGKVWNHTPGEIIAQAERHIWIRVNDFIDIHSKA